MNSCVYVGHIMHARREPVAHRFRYPAYLLALDIDELGALDRGSWLFGHNRRALFALHEADYLGDAPGGLRDKLAARVAAAGHRIALDRVVLVTVPRFAGHAFNPVSFYYCFAAGGELDGLVVEVNNTFGEGHVYVLPARYGSIGERGGIRFVADKRFHVSPFNDMSGVYEFDFGPFGERLDVRIDIRRRGGKTFASRIVGHGRRLDHRALAGVALRYPLTAALTLPRIMLQACQLHYRKQLPVVPKPAPSSSDTFAAIRPAYISEFSAPSWFSRRRAHEVKEPMEAIDATTETGAPHPGATETGAPHPATTETGAPRTAATETSVPRPAATGLWGRGGARFIHAYLARLATGHITVAGPGGLGEASFGDPDAGLRATITVHTGRFFWRTLAGGDIGFAESYMRGEWSTDELPALIEILAINRDALDGLSLATALPRRLLARAYHLSRRNTVAGNRRNIQDHYDLGNDFFRLFLDSSMTYSCGIYAGREASLEDAQQRKIQAIIAKAQINPEHHVLEIGGGWGSLAIAAVRRTGCRVTMLTLSDEQKAWVERRVREAGLGHRIDVRIADYRTIQGRFDRIVSVEMLEAVGRQNLGAYFAACDRLLRRDGRAAIQAITIRDDLYDAYSKGCDFIQRYIFPGGHLPCRAALSAAIDSHSGLSVRDIEEIGPHYARTLAHWRQRFNHRVDDIRALGFGDSFVRKWNYYFAYCEAGFRARMLGAVQIVLTK